MNNKVCGWEKQTTTLWDSYIITRNKQFDKQTLYSELGQPYKFRYGIPTFHYNSLILKGLKHTSSNQSNSVPQSITLSKVVTLKTVKNSQTTQTTWLMAGVWYTNSRTATGLHFHVLPFLKTLYKVCQWK